MTSAGSRSGRTQGGSRQAEIVVAAAALFDQYGYHTTSLADIGDAVGISKATVYHYFARKDEILESIHEEFIDLLLDAYESGDVAEEDPREGLLLVMSDIIRLMHTHRSHVRVFFEHRRELPAAEQGRLTIKRDRYFNHVVDLVERGASTGLLVTDSPRLTALMIFGACNWAYSWYQPGGQLSTDDIARHFWRVLMGGLSSDGYSDSLADEPSKSPMAGESLGVTAGAWGHETGNGPTGSEGHP